MHKKLLSIIIEPSFGISVLQVLSTVYSIGKVTKAHEWQITIEYYRLTVLLGLFQPLIIQVTKIHKKWNIKVFRETNYLGKRKKNCCLLTVILIVLSAYLFASVSPPVIYLLGQYSSGVLSGISILTLDCDTEPVNGLARV